MKSLLYFFIAFALFHTNSATADQVTVEKNSFCHYKRTVFRSVRIETYPSKWCDTVYTKKGSDKRVGGGQNQYSCIKVYDNIISNLTLADWSCNDVSGSKFTVEPATSTKQSL